MSLRFDLREELLSHMMAEDADEAMVAWDRDMPDAQLRTGSTAGTSRPRVYRMSWGVMLYDGDVISGGAAYRYKMVEKRWELFSTF